MRYFAPQRMNPALRPGEPRVSRLVRFRQPRSPLTILALAFLLAGCAPTMRPCQILNADTGAEVNIHMTCECEGTPIQSMTCRRTE